MITADLRTDENGQWIDPRICPGVYPDGSWSIRPEDKEDDQHYWGHNASYSVCMHCGISSTTLRDAFRDWRYEIVIERLAAALEGLRP